MSRDWLATMRVVDSCLPVLVILAFVESFNCVDRGGGDSEAPRVR